jgi:hypothetical protein
MVGRFEPLKDEEGAKPTTHGREILTRQICRLQLQLSFVAHLGLPHPLSQRRRSCPHH